LQAVSCSGEQESEYFSQNVRDYLTEPLVCVIINMRVNPSLIEKVIFEKKIRINSIRFLKWKKLSWNKNLLTIQQYKLYSA
jgi:hypothetical protein